MMQRTFEKKLYSFFISKYADYESAEFYIPPKKNQYVFDFPVRKQRIVLTCCEDGSIEEKIIQYTAANLARSSKKIQRAEAQSRDYSDLFDINKSGSCLPLATTILFHKAILEEKNQAIRNPWNNFKL